jgi:integrase
MGDNPAKDLDVVAMPLPPVENNPFLRMPELPAMLQTLRKYSGRLNTQLGLRLLLLTGVRTGELRYATPDQFDLERGLWIIPVVRLKQRKQLTKKKRQRFADIPPYIVPLSLQAQEVVRNLLGNLKPAQVYLIPGDRCLKNPLSENTLNGALKRMRFSPRVNAAGTPASAWSTCSRKVCSVILVWSSLSSMRSIHQSLYGSSCSEPRFILFITAM